MAISGAHAFVGAPNMNFPLRQTGNGGWKAFLPAPIYENGFD